jgi:hypothetical protein
MKAARHDHLMTASMLMFLFQLFLQLSTAARCAEQQHQTHRSAQLFRWDVTGQWM